MNGPARRVEEAAEAIRALNYATLPGAGELMFPADAYETAGVLAVLAARLPQALAQLSAFLQEQVNAGRIVIVAGEHAGDPAAASSARQLQQSLDAAQQSLTWAAAASSRLARHHGNETVKTTWPGTRYVSMLTASARGVSDVRWPEMRLFMVVCVPVLPAVVMLAAQMRGICKRCHEILSW